MLMVPRLVLRFLALTLPVGVEDAQLARRQKQALVVTLCADIKELGGHRCQVAQSRHCTADGGRGATVALDGAPYDGHPLIKGESLTIQEPLQRLARSPSQVEGGGNRGTLTAASDRLHIGLGAEQEAQGTEDDRFSRPGLTADDGEVLIKLDDRILDEGVVVDFKALKHASLPTS